VDRRGSNNYEQRTAAQHYLVSLEQADNLFELELRKNQGNRGDLFKAGYKNRFDDQTAPSAKWWNGTNSGMKIYNMSNVSDTMSFSIGDTNSIKRYQVTISTSDHGTVSPTGAIQVVAGQSLRLVIKPDSGYQIDEIKINGSTTTVKDTITLSNINSNQTVEVQFALKAALLCLSPSEGDLYYVGDTMYISWQLRGITVQGIELSFSTNNGKTFTSITDAVSSGENSRLWITADVESDSCRLRIADRDGSPSVLSDIFSIRRKPQISVNDQPMTFTIAKGQTVTNTLYVKNDGTGDLAISATTQKQIRRVLINEISMGVTTQDADAIEIWNSGTDIDISGWKVSWDDNKGTSGSYTFKDGTILKSGSTFTLYDLENYKSNSSDYMGINVVWRTNDFLELSVLITDRNGNGVDFVKSNGSLTSPPEEIDWKGDGIELCSAFVYRKNFIDTDSSIDWGCTQNGTLKEHNNSQQNNVPTPFLVLSPLSQSINRNSTGNYAINIDASKLESGTYYDTILLYHNDPLKPSPQKIPCQITVHEPSSVKYNRLAAPETKNGSASAAQLSVVPNPVNAGQSINIWYSPAGNERYGELAIFNNIGKCQYHQKVTFSISNSSVRNPIHFSWLPDKIIKGSETYLIRMNVTCKDGSKAVYSTLAGRK
ncbi:MAG: lamin tail domain-containing protein, partial [Fibrobacter sp.]|nr:lamin tail domain-containing protein [Fibrobacter sp.]